MPVPVNALPSGYSLHEYRIDSLLGVGGFGLTYLATDANLNLRVALKEYLPNDIAARAGDSTVHPKSSSAAEPYQWGLQRFMHEARTLASFRHPNIVRVMRFFEANSTGYMVMEFVEGKPLTEWIGTRRPLDQHTLLAMADPLLDGLEVIHKSGYLHRDVKPANIFIRDDGSPVLLDFGSARQLVGGAQELTAVVSPGYAPLEQYHTHGKQGPWTDLYAFGGVMYWLITGERPVEAAARVREDVMRPAARAESAARYTADFLAAVDWALKPHEDKRPQSIAEFRRTLLGATPRSRPADRTAGFTPASGVATGPADAGSMTGFTGVALDREQLKRVEAELSRSIGPIAPVVVRKAARTAPSIPALATAVSGEIADATQRAAFLRKFAGGEATTGASGPAAQRVFDASISQKFSTDILRSAEKALAQYIGSIANLVVRRAAAKARDEAELYLLISDEIKDPAERKNFVRKAITASRPR